MSTQQQPPFQPPPPRYTPEEWQLLCELPLRVGVTVLLAGQHGVGEKLQGAMSALTSHTQAAREYPQNQLIQGIVQERGVYNKDLQEAFMTKAGDAIQVRADTLNACRRAMALLEQKASPQEVEEFKRWLLGIGDKVANASVEGSFLGLGFGSGARVSAEESQALQELASALQITR